MRILALIPARGGSKGVPGKNIKPLVNKPLIHYTIEAARKIFDDKYICVSSDDNQIIKTAESAGLIVPFIRPAELATDTASSYDVMLHAISYYEGIGYKPDVLVLLQPTSPFRTSSQIEESIKLFHSGIDMVVSVKETKSNPYYVLYEENKEGYLEKSKKSNFSRRQDCPKVWELNGAIYVINVESLKSRSIADFTKIIKMPMDDISSLDIDTPLDWEFAEFITKNNLTPFVNSK